MATSKLERLLNLTAALLDTERPLTAEELRARIPGYAERDDAFRRTFERDKDDLRSMGVPLRTETVPGTDPPIDGYRIHRADYQGRDPDLDPDELAALHLATNLVRVGRLDAEGALLRLGAGEADAGAPAGGPIVALPSDDNLGPLFDAAARLHPVRLRYKNEDRRIDPHRLSFNRGHWYLSGYDHGRDDERIFRVDRIEGTVTVDEQRRFERPEAPPGPPSLVSWELGDAEPVEARVLVDADQAQWAGHHLGPDAVVGTRPDGSVEFRLTVRNAAAFRSFVLSFLDHAVVLSPPALVDEIVTWLGGQAR